MINAIIGVVVGLTLIAGGGQELLKWWWGRRQRQRVPGVFVGRRDVGPPQVVSRAGRFRFTTRDGQTLEALSSMSTFPGPKPGKRVTISYDPADPAGSAEVTGVLRFKIVLSPLIVLGGVVLAVYSITLF